MMGYMTSRAGGKKKKKVFEAQNVQMDRWTQTSGSAGRKKYIIPAERRYLSKGVSPANEDKLGKRCEGSRKKRDELMGNK